MNYFLSYTNLNLTMIYKTRGGSKKPNKCNLSTLIGLSTIRNDESSLTSEKFLKDATTLIEGENQNYP